MKRQIRYGVFETNSSSVHSITMCSQEEYDKWKAGELLWARYDDCFVDATDPAYLDDGAFLTLDQFKDYNYIDFETFVETYTTKGGETVVAFGYYGSDY